ncbi:lysylphosphatidylglycerol synthase transmembrane domain-containing protein [Bacillus tuaregi]|uniref:lysylphosphatidylglycerol synthase transmembrane domain-containing protein n=1 Tax=Bacillus tuaregi TaxID=1816695 RepID=UPI0008F8FD8B|nr:lysylphosphatidylglycerol synthase transmembrane domain-containing protein [Bacillus tuaregi]
MSHEKIEKAKSRIQLILRMAVSAGLMVWLMLMIEWEEALRVMKEGSPLFLCAAFIAIQITVLTSIWKWKMLVDSSSKQSSNKYTSMAKLGQLYYIGLFFNNFMPGSVGGDVVRIYYLGKNTTVSTATASVLFERLTSGLALVGIVLISALFMDQSRPYIISLCILLAVSIIGYLLIKHWLKKDIHHSIQPKTTTILGKINSSLIKGKQAIRGVGEKAMDYRTESWKWWGMILLLSLLFQIGMAWINDLLFLSFGIDIPFLHLLVIITLISVITMLPVSLNGLGVREAGYVFFFQGLGVPQGIALSVSLLFFFLVTISSAIGGLFWLIERREARHEAIRQ